VTTGTLRASDGTAPTTGAARRAIGDARERMQTRLRGTGWTMNAEVTGAWLRGDGRAATGASDILDRALDLGTLTMRGWDRVMRLAWTIADLDGDHRPDRRHVERALALRTAL
jgi:magnesium chelatase family protein